MKKNNSSIGILNIALLTMFLIFPAFAQQKLVVVDAGKDLGAFKLLVGTNCGPHAMQGSNDDYTQIYKDLGIKAVRTHDYYGPCDWYTIFPDWSKDSQNPASYNFTTTDTVIKKVIDGGFEVLFRIGPSWNDPVYEYHTDPPGTIRDTQGNIIHAADLTDFIKFADICKHILMHYNQGWANGFHYNIKKWEIWNEPSLRDHFWSGTPLQFYQMFETVIKTLKAYDSSLFVGGPGLAGQPQRAYQENLIAYCAQNNVPLDFFSWHSYGGIGTGSPDDFENKAVLLRGLLDSYGYGETALVCDEWNAGLDQNSFARSGKGAAFYVSTLKSFIDHNIPECYQYRGDNHPLGLVGTDGALKNAAYSLKAWKLLTESTIRLETTGSESSEFAALASRSADNRTLRVLLSNYLNETKRITLQVNNMPIQPQYGWMMERQVINNTLKLEVVESTNVGGGAAIAYSFDMQPESVHLLKFTPATDGDNGDGDGDEDGNGKCAIATACFGTSTAEEVQFLCALRDRYLLTNHQGRALVRAYYHISPTIAGLIQDKEYLRMIVREHLKPLIWIARMIVH